jgi:hypothetical protein
MRSSVRAGVLGCVLLAGGCTPTRYTNPSHPEFGTQQYDSDRALCEKANSKVTVHQGYDIVTEVTVDQDGVKSCLAAKGWQPVTK